MNVIPKNFVENLSSQRWKRFATSGLNIFGKKFRVFGNWNVIFQKLNEQGLIAKTPKLNYVKITHWGVKEASKSGSSEKPDTALLLKKRRRVRLEKRNNFWYCSKNSPPKRRRRISIKFKKKFKKNNDINSAIKQLKTNTE